MNTTSTCLWNISRHGDYTTPLGSLFQCLTALAMKKPLLIPTWTSPGPTLGHFFLSCLLSWEKRVIPTSLQPPEELWRVIMFPLILLLSLPFMMGIRELLVNLLALFNSSNNKKIKSWSADFQEIDLAIWVLQSHTGGVGGVGTMSLLDADVPSQLIYWRLY